MRILKKLLVVIVVLWGLLALMVRSATPFIADYRDELAGLISARLGVPVEIGAMKARWYGLQPLLEIDRVRIGHPAREVLEVERATLDLALDHLLLGSLLDAARVTIDGMQLTVIREPTGQLHVEGVGAITPQDGRGSGPIGLPSHVRLLDTRILWIDRKAGRDPLSIHNVAVVLDRTGNRLQMRASLETGLGKAELSARLDGLLTTTTWSGDSYLRISNLDAADLFAHYLPAHYGLHSLRLDLESWSRWENATPVHTQGDFQLRDLDLRPSVQGSSSLEVWQAGARFSFLRQPTGLRLGLKDLQLTFHDHRWPTGDLAFALSQGPDGSRQIEAAADFLQLDDVVRILRVRMPWKDLKGPLEQLQPGGEIHALRFSAETVAERLDWRGRARFTGVTIDPSPGAPGVANLSGDLHGQSDHLLLRLDSRDTTLDFAGLFREPLALEELQGRIDLVSRGDGWVISTDRLQAVSPHIRTLSRLQLDYRPDRPPFLDLQTDFIDGDAAFAGRYYPVSIMGEGLVRWLDRAIVGGRVARGTALLHGPMDSFAFERDRNGVFQVLFDAEDVVLDYRDGWPRIEGLAAQVKFHGNQLDILAREGRIYDSRIAEASAHIGTLKPAGAIRVQGRLDGPLQDNLRVLGEGALRPRFGRFAEILRGEGDTSLLLDFSVPLAGRGDYALDGRLALAGNRLVLSDWDLPLDQIEGTLNFTLDGLSATDVRARLLDTPVGIEVLPRTEGGTRVEARGHFAGTDIARRLPSIPTMLVTGAADFSVGVDIAARDTADENPATLSVGSDLRGIEVALPAPFGKPAGESRPLAVEIPLGGAAARAGSGRYGELVSARFSTDGERVDVVLGGGRAQLQAAPGVRIGGQLEVLDLPAWAEVYAALPSQEGDRRRPLTADLRVDKLQVYNTTLEKLHFTASRDQGIWRGGVDAANLVGTFMAPERPDTVPISVALERLAVEIPLGSMDAAVPAIPDPGAGPDPATLPGLVLDIADLRVNDARLGRLRVDAQRAPEGLRVTEISLRGGDFELDSAGHWSNQGGRFRTELGGSLSTENLGGLLVNLGYSRQVEGAGGKADFLLQWPGSPGQFHRATVQGRVGLDVAAGRVVELDPGVTRVVGLLNLNALTRRLRLDFSDFYKKGYSFDSIRGDFLFERGLATSDNLQVLGPTGRIDLRGSADLVTRSLDQKVTVTPNLDATLPIAGAIAGGPVAGLAVLVAQKAMTKQVDEINRFEYRLSGPWDQPEVKQLDTGGTLSKILRPLRPEADSASGTSDAAREPPTIDPAPGTTSVFPTTDNAAEPAWDPVEEQQASDSVGPLDGLLDLLKQGKPYGTDLPGTSE